MTAPAIYSNRIDPAHAGTRTVISSKGRGDHLWEHPRGVGRGCKAAKAATTSLARPRADYRDCFGEVVDMPQCVFGARRPSHRSSQVPPPHSSMALPLWEIPSLNARPDKAVARFLWEARPRGDARLDAPRIFDRGEGAAPTTTPSPSRGEGWGGGERRPATPPRSVRTKSTPTLSFPADGAADYPWAIPCLHASWDKAAARFLWEHPQGVGRGCKAAAPRDTPADKAATTSLARPRADYRDRFGDVVDMPQCVFGARRPSHRSSQVPPPNPLSLRDSGVRRNDLLNGGQQ